MIKNEFSLHDALVLHGTELSIQRRICLWPGISDDVNTLIVKATVQQYQLTSSSLTPIVCGFKHECLPWWIQLFNSFQVSTYDASKIYKLLSHLSICLRATVFFFYTGQSRLMIVSCEAKKKQAILDEMSVSFICSIIQKFTDVVNKLPRKLSFGFC